MEEEFDNLLKKGLSKISGKKESEIKIEDFKPTRKGRPKKSQKKPKKIKKAPAKSGELLLTSNAKTDYINFNEIEEIKELKSREQKENIFEWDKAVDFVYYIFDWYRRKYKEPINLKIPAASLEINRIRDLIYDITGFYSPLVLKDYIDYCLKKFIPKLVKKNKAFYISYFRNKYYIKVFYNNYNYKRSFEKQCRKTEKKHVNNKNISNDKISDVYSLSQRKLLCEYGIILSMNWLLMKQKMHFNNAQKIIFSTCSKMHKEGAFSFVKRATEFWSPYPEWFIFKEQIYSLLEKIDNEIKCDVKFVNKKERNEIFKFLKENNGKDIFSQ